MDGTFERIRVEYRNLPLDRSDLDDDPLVQFERWFTTAETAGIDEPNAFVLATADREGRPSARTVLLKGVGADGFDFYTNYQSRKGVEIAANPRVAAVFLWVPIRRQVRIEGTVSKLDPAKSDSYFRSRPPEARLASAASPQSRPVTHRAELEALLEELRQSYPAGDVPRPQHWGGYRIAPDSYEFWQGREARFHDRFRYLREGREWRIERLAP
ncbi:MAG: pyridoxamine 5'-phosphate oxidase [Acidimicrobiia bacterium]